MGDAILYRSSRGGTPTLRFSEALRQGLAPDGGLYVPAEWPRVDVGAFRDITGLPAVGARLLEPFLGGDRLQAELPGLTAEAFNFPAPLVPLDADGGPSVLELFHGPTGAFKDFGARFLAASLARMRKSGEPTLTILVATSGDTGGAVAAAFHQRPGFEVVVLFPKGRVSPTQERQLTCWGGNVRSIAVRGTFDDCQRLVKEAFRDPEVAAGRSLTSANSINLGRLLPQSMYYAAASLAVLRDHGDRASFIVPSGNLGNALACLWARRAGMPIDEVVLAHNANRTVPDYLATGIWQPRASIPTLASAMDVGDPSNVERLRALFPRLEELRAAVSAYFVTDDEIRARIRQGYRQYAQIWCPHTATAAQVWERLPADLRRGRRWVLVATAHPGKFPEIVEPCIGAEVPTPEALVRLFARPVQCVEISANLSALREVLAGVPEWTS